MAKKSLIVREYKKNILVNKYYKKRLLLKSQLKNTINSTDCILKILNKLQKLPKKSSPTKLRNRCTLTGRARGIYSEYKISRFVFRHLALNGLLPGVLKSSW